MSLQCIVDFVKVGLFFIIFLLTPLFSAKISLGKLEPGSLGPMACISEKDCVPNAYCMDAGYCSCRDDYVEDSTFRSCLSKATNINDTCSIDIQCMSTFGLYATCDKPSPAAREGRCQCVDNAHFQDGICYESVRLGGRCKVSDNCVSRSDVATYCAHSTCVCTARYHPSDDRLDCLPDVALGEVCRSDEDCVTASSYCSGVCKCQPGYVSSADGTKCLLAAKTLGVECEEDLQCQENLPNAVCDAQSRSCRCTPTAHELVGACWKSVGLGEACSHPNECATPSLNRSVVSCHVGVCGCVRGYEWSGKVCVLSSSPPKGLANASRSLESTFQSRLVLTTMALFCLCISGRNC